MDFKIIHPKNPKINEYLNFSYTGFLNNVSYYAYPHYGVPIAFFKDVDISFTEEKMLITPSKVKSIKCVYVNTFYKPVKIETEGNIEEFCLIFRPYGLAQFVNKLPRIDSNKKYFYFTLFDDFITAHPNLFSYSAAKKNDALELYLASKISEKKYTEYIKDAIRNLQSKNTTQHIYPISSKTFYRAYKNICGVPESVLLKTIQFRKSLKKMMIENPEKTKCELAHDLGYFDQAHFNKLFKQLTAETPSDFINQVSPITEKNMYFKIS